MRPVLRWSVAGTLAFLFVGLLLVTAAICAPPSRPAPAGAAPNEPPSPCRDYDPSSGQLLSSRDVIPSEILDCETAAVSVTVRASCADAPLHVLIDLDRSRSMTGQPCVDVKAASMALLDVLDMPHNPSTLVGLVTHGEQAETNLHLTDDEAAVRGAVNDVTCGRVVDNLADSIERSTQELLMGRSATSVNPVDVIIVLSDGGQARPATDALAPAARARARGIIIVSVCNENLHWGSSCDVMEQLATSHSYFFDVHDTAAFSQVFQDIGKRFREVHLQNLTIAEALPPGLRLVPGSVRPPADFDPNGSVLTWRPDVTNTEAITYTYRVAPTKLGHYPLAVFSADYHDNAGRVGHIRVPTHTLSVPAPCVRPSATSTTTPTTVATTTPTPSPTVTPTEVTPPTPTLTATATGLPQPLYLPLALREQCVPGQQHVDVALVIDASTSMSDEKTAGGRSKLDAAKDAVRPFLTNLDLAGGDQAAIVQFNADAKVLQQLTRNRADLDTALAQISVARQTRIQAGIPAARDELMSPRHAPLNSRAMVVLTDGKNNPEPVAVAETEATAAKANAIRLFTIGLGADVEQDALRRMASGPTDYFYAPDGEDLLAIYEAIAVAIPCPREAFWGRR
jgi:Mg-chelatase subunit ChlD